MRDLVGEESCFTDILAIEEMIREASGGRGQIEGGEVGNCAVAEGAPCCGEGKDSQDGSGQRREEFHHEQVYGEMLRNGVGLSRTAGTP